MPPRRNQSADIYVAKHPFHCELDGERIYVHTGERVRRGHPLLSAYEDYFEPVDQRVHYDVEQATAAPGEQRGTR